VTGSGSGQAAADIRRQVVIDSFAGTFPGFRPGFAVVAVDVIRATTMAVTAVLLGRQCYPAATLDAAVELARRLPDPLLAGELGGNMPYGFDMDNSPVALTERSDARPLVLLSTSGTQLICDAASEATAVYVACLRNISAQAAYLADAHARVALVGAGSRGEFREEDQLCCAWIAGRLLAHGLHADPPTRALVDRWRGASVQDMLVSNSVRYLCLTGRERDLEFVLGHVDDIAAVFQFQNEQIINLDLASGS